MAARNWLVAIDGSETSLKAVDWIVAHLGDWKETPALHLLNVQPALPRDISRFVNAKQIDDFHREEGLKALAAAAEKSRAAGMAPQLHVSVGDCAETIVGFAVAKGCDQILIGTRGHTGLGGTLLGSVASKVAHLTHIPLLLVR